MRKVLFLIIALGIAGFVSRDRITALFFAPRNSRTSPAEFITNIRDSNNTSSTPRENLEVIAKDLDTPWEIVFLPDNSLLVTERPGRLTKVFPDGTKSTIFTFGEVSESGEGGLLGLALHPDFIQNQLIYVYLTTSDGGLTNKVLRFKLENDALSERVVILEGIPGSAVHDGGRIKFGPDGFLYITTGDAGNTQSAQDRNSLSGKILRLTDDGSIPSSNPFGNATYSYGHRNPQGLAWDSAGQLWATEHGPSGTETGNDELNRIEIGKNYGWPTIRGTQANEGMETPVIESGRQDTWAPGGLAYLNGSLYFGGLRGSALYEFSSNTLSEHFKNEYGRIRVVEVGPDGFLYLATSNRDGRGTIQEGDDKIIRINQEVLR